jgi:hypothetical protein
MNEQVREPEWAPEADGSNERNRRRWSIDELRNKVGVAAPEQRDVPRTVETTMMERPRIVRRGMAPALA